MAHLCVVAASLKTSGSHHKLCKSPRKERKSVSQPVDSLWQVCSVYYLKLNICWKVLLFYDFFFITAPKSHLILLSRPPRPTVSITSHVTFGLAGCRSLGFPKEEDKTECPAWIVRGHFYPLLGKTPPRRQNKLVLTFPFLSKCLQQLRMTVAL